MYNASRQRLLQLLDAHGPELLQGGLKGLEKESLRVTPDGNIATTPHPQALGSALTHHWITTDYSEALLEFITDPYSDSNATLTELHDIHRFVYDQLDDELLWATSMPCVLSDGEIPIAHYGTSNVGMMKHVYRRGLDVRYGRIMQAIAGIHFNYSVPEPLWDALLRLSSDPRPRQAFISDAYFGLIRNFQRIGWIVPYLFGASPAVCNSFLQGRDPGFERFDEGTRYLPFATSLRMSDIGYKNRSQTGLDISYNDLDAYVDSLTRAIETPDPEYARIGTRADGEWRQLNTNLLQIENEYYSFVRPKVRAGSGEKPSLALRRRGVRYVEIRALDLNPFDPTGVNSHTLRFLEALMLFCLLEDSPPITAIERAGIDRNQLQVARAGRDPAMRLVRSGGESIGLREWADAICSAMETICSALDGDDPEQPFSRALAHVRQTIARPDQLPSSRVLEIMRQREQSFVAFAMAQSRAHKAHYRSETLSEQVRTRFETEARRSLSEQSEIEASDTLSFEEYLADYFAQR